MTDKPKVLPAKGSNQRKLMDAAVAAGKAGKPFSGDLVDLSKRPKRST